MAGLVSDVEKSGALLVFSGSFDTWSRQIIVFKESIKTPVDTPSSNNLFGFGDSQMNTIYTLTPKSGIFQAIVRYNDIDRNPARDSVLSSEILARIYSGPISIKVRKDCRDYLNDGETQSVQIDNQVFLVNSDERLQTMWGSEYYIFALRKTK